MARPKKVYKIRLEVHYEPAEEPQASNAVDLLAVMFGEYQQSRLRASRALPQARAKMTPMKNFQYPLPNP